MGNERGRPSADLSRIAAADHTTLDLRSTRQRWALAALPPDDPLVLAEHRRLIEAIEAVHQSAKLLGLDPIEQYASFGVRCDGWLWRTREVTP